MYGALKRRVAALTEAGLRRQLQSLRMTSPTSGMLDGRQVEVFCANDYLGLAQHPEVVAAYQGAGAGAAREERETHADAR